MTEDEMKPMTATELMERASKMHHRDHERQRHQENLINFVKDYAPRDPDKIMQFHSRLSALQQQAMWLAQQPFVEAAANAIAMAPVKPIFIEASSPLAAAAASVKASLKQ